MQVRTRILQAMVVAFACVAVYLSAWLPGFTFAGMDFLNLLYPQAHLVKSAFAVGELPLWNWYSWNGSPLLAAMQSAPVYPPMWVTLLLPLPWGLQVNILAHLIFAGMGATLLAERIFLVRPKLAICAGIIYSCSGFLFGHFEQVNTIAAASWAPWILLFGIEQVVTGGRLPHVAISCALAMLSGHPHHVVLAIFFLQLFAIGWLGHSIWKRELRVALPHFILLQVALVLAGALAAAQILPSRELAGLSERVWPYDDPNEPALKWSQLAALFVPRFFNTLANTPGQPLGFSELGMYVSMLGACLGLVGIIVGLRKPGAGVRIMAAVMVLALLYALGKSGFVTTVAFKIVPFLGQSRGAARALNVFCLLFAVFASVGVQWVILRVPSRFCTTVLFSLILIILADFSLTHQTELNHRLVKSELLSATKPQLQTTLNINGPNRLYRFMMHDSDFYLDQRQAAVAQRARRLQPNLGALWGVATMDGYEEGLLPPRHLANFLRRYNRNLRNAEPDGRLLALLGVTSMITDLPGIQFPHAARQFEREELALWMSEQRNTWFLDKATLQKHRNTAPSYWTPKRRHEFPYEQPGKEVTKHPYSDVPWTEFSKAASNSGIEVRAIRTNEIELTLRGGPARDVHFLQAWYPGWKLVREDDVFLIGLAEAPIFTTWRIPASSYDHQARLFFAPFSYRLGAFISFAALSVLVLVSFQRKTRHVTSALT